MWPFSRKRKHQTLLERGFFKGFTDWHSHILPGVDDGVQTMEEALQILKKYEDLGVKEVWLTPHIMEDIPNTTALLKERFTELQTSYQGNVRLHLAAENMLDNLFEERLEKNDLLPIGEHKDHLLVETSYFNPPMGLYDTLQHIKAKGYYLILAHPERYTYMEKEDYRKLKTMGIKFQLNIPSLAGIYGKEAQKKAEWLTEQNMYDLHGTDLHRTEMLDKVLRADLAESQLKNVDKRNTEDVGYYKLVSDYALFFSRKI